MSNHTFLQSVASHLMSQYGNKLNQVAVVFPNKRASIFLDQALMQAAGHPIWSPAYFTISELFRSLSDFNVPDKIELVFELYKVYLAETQTTETLDHFYGWGDILLADFDDIDKNLANADQVLANITDLHQFDDVDYLTPEQKKLLSDFFGNFDSDNVSRLKQQFLNVWQHLRDIYHRYNQQLADKGMCYEGALYRQVAQHGDLSKLPYKQYIFVGFNMMQVAEVKFCENLQKQGRAKFYWDFDNGYMPAKGSQPGEPGYFIEKYLKVFPNELDSDNADIYDNLARPKQITFVSANTESIQARFIPTWLQKGDKIADGSETAIVMCDEHLLPLVVHNLPTTGEHPVTEVNITTGYPVNQSAIATFVEQLIAFRTTYNRSNSGYYNVSMVMPLLSHPYMKYLTTEARQIIQRIVDGHLFKVKVTNLLSDEGLKLLFAPAKPQPTEQAEAVATTQWLMEVIQYIAVKFDKTSSPFDAEAIFRIYTLLNRISALMADSDLNISINIWHNLVNQLINQASIPFHGEPAIGLQVMGVLESRNLDFKHVLLLSCNEGNMPKGINDTSFIPYSIRKAYGLTTVDNKVAIYAYYFYSLIQRADDVTIVFNNSTENGSTGEMSRFLLQLMVSSKNDIKHINLQAEKSATLPHTPKAIAKTAEIMKVLHSLSLLSPSAINRYMRCPLKFYFNIVAQLKEPDNTDDDVIDSRMFGNLFHKSAQLLYQTWLGRILTEDQIKGLLKNRQLLNRMVDKAFMEVYFKMPDSDKAPDLNGMQLIMKKVIVNYLVHLLNADLNLSPFRVLALEQNVVTRMKIKTSEGNFGVTVGGNIDRMDQVRNGSKDMIRIIDYKTGKQPTKSPADLDEVFNPENISAKHSDYYLQAMLYALITRYNQHYNADNLAVAPALLYIQRMNAKDYNAILSFNNGQINDVAPYNEAFTEHLSAVISEIMEPTRDFTPTENEKECNFCPYREICR